MDTRTLLLLLTSILFFSGIALGQTASEAYTPASGACPSNFSLVRLTDDPATGQTLNPEEVSYISTRKSTVLPGAFKTYLTNVIRTGVPLPYYVHTILEGSNPSMLPTVGIATSGGSYRAAMFGAGVLNALDGRNESSVRVGTGGLLQATSYISGLSGGSWLVYSLAQSNFPTMQDLILGPSTPDASATGYGGWTTTLGTYTLDPSGDNATSQEYMAQMVRDIQGKFDAGYPVTIVDLVSRVMGRHFLNGTTAQNFFDNSTLHGAGVMFSDLVNVSTFTQREQPFTIVVSDGWSKYPNGSSYEAPGNDIPPSNVIYEFNAYEMGSYDPQLAAFTPIKYLGTTNDSVCVTGFEQAGFVIGSSSDYFQSANSSAAALMASAGPWVSLVNESFSQPDVQLDAALFPNPFQGQGNGSFADTNETFLSLVDGGNDGQVIPIQPLLVKAREVDVLIAVDVNAEVNNYATGCDFIASAQRAALFPTAYSFPPVPSTSATFISQNLTLHPTFFGCDTPSTPLIVYIANGGPPKGQAPITNTTDDTLTEPLIQSILSQTFDIATQGLPADPAATRDTEWGACLACAVVDRVRERSGIERSGVCASCFTRYCWNGTQ